VPLLRIVSRSSGPGNIDLGGKLACPSCSVKELTLTISLGTRLPNGSLRQVLWSLHLLTYQFTVPHNNILISFIEPNDQGLLWAIFGCNRADVC
jgi:hypothetical protein